MVVDAADGSDASDRNVLLVITSTAVHIALELSDRPEVSGTVATGAAMGGEGGKGPLSVAEARGPVGPVSAAWGVSGVSTSVCGSCGSM
jgi:hypothetical protein